MALLAYRATPLQCGYSPSELRMSRKLRTSVPTTRLCKQQKLRQERNFNHRHRASALPHLRSGSRVWVPDRNSDPTVVEETNPRSYQIETPEGTYRRNRRALVPLPVQTGDHDPTDSDSVSFQDSQSGQHVSCSETPNRTDQNPERSTSNESRRHSERRSRPPDRLDPSWT